MTLPPGTNIIRCKCGADFFFVEVVVSGKKMPLDLKPEKRVVLLPGEDGVLRGQVQDTYVSHFFTCPLADQFRKAK